MLNPFLIAAAVIPAILLLKYVYKMDRLEKEPPALIRRLVLLGLASTLLASITEGIGLGVLRAAFPEGSLLYNIFMYFIVVAVSEEGFKYLLLKKGSWNEPAFNCMFDGVVYGVTIALGFALWENIGYVAQFGFGTALVRAVTAIPGHASFGVFMGAYYGAAKKASVAGQEAESKRLRNRALLIPALLHGLYDFIASGEHELYFLIFLVFIVLLFTRAKNTVRQLAANDSYF